MHGSGGRGVSHLPLRPELQDKPRNLLHRETGGLGWGSVSLLSAHSPGWLPSKDRLFDLSQFCRIHECKHPAPCPPEPGYHRASPRQQLQTWGHWMQKPRLGPSGKLLSRRHWLLGAQQQESLEAVPVLQGLCKGLQSATGCVFN